MDETTYVMPIEIYSEYESGNNLLVQANVVYSFGDDEEQGMSDNLSIEDIKYGPAGLVYNIDKISNIEDILFEKTKQITSDYGISNSSFVFEFDIDTMQELREDIGMFSEILLDSEPNNPDISDIDRD